MMTLASLPTTRALLDSWTVAPEAPAAVSLRFLWNGIKGADGKLQKASYSFSKAWSDDYRSVPMHLTIYHNSHCGSFNADVSEAFEVENATDSQTDYFVSDRITVEIDHPLFATVAEAFIAQQTHRAKHSDKMDAKRGRKPSGDGYRKDIADVRAILARMSIRAVA